MKAFLKLILYKPIYNFLILLIFVIPGHYLGVAVVVLTVIIRFALLPTTRSVTRQQALITKLKPELDKIQLEHKNDQAASAKATMAFYKKHHINPMGSCLPMVLQLVILVVLYRVFQAGLTAVRPDLIYPFTPQPDFINPNFLWINLSQPDLWVLPIVTGVLQFVQTWQMTPKGKSISKDTATNLQRQMVFLFPIMTVLISRKFSAALPLYWSISSIFSIIQQHYILKQTAKITVGQADKILESGTDGVSVGEEKEVIRKKGVEITVRKKPGRKE